MCVCVCIYMCVYVSVYSKDTYLLNCKSKLCGRAASDPVVVVYFNMVEPPPTRAIFVRPPSIRCKLN